MSKRSAAATLPIWIAAAFSGGAALAYEICWSRALVVPLGNSTDAAALVLAGFMLGIAGGARLGGGLAERVASPLRLYALLELLLGLYALMAPLLLGLLSQIPASLGGVTPAALGVAVRYAGALVLIALPSLAMGATLPLLVRALTTRSTSLRYQISIAYGANTGGAAVGAFVTGFWGISTLGIWLCSALAATGSLAAAGLALVASFSVARPSRAARSGASEPGRVAPGSVLRCLALGAAFVSGFAMLACELLWARVLTFVFGHDTYAFASLLAFVLFGLALGGLVHRLLAPFSQAKLLAGLLGLFALFVLASFWVAASLVVHLGRDPFGLQASGSFATSVWLELYRELLYTPILVLLPSVLSGALFPTACSLYGGDADDAGRKVGIVGLVNGLGSTLGALVAAFGLVSVAGLQGAFVVLALVCGAAASAVLLWTRPLRLRASALAMLPLLGAALLAVLMPRGLPRLMLLKAVGERHQTLVYYEEARTGTVSVILNQVNGEKQLLMNAVNEVTTRLVHDQSFKVLGHLGPLLHPKPKTALMICLGAGISAGAAAIHPLERLDVVELSSAMPRAARHWTAENNGVLDDPVFHLHIDDGRQFLLNSTGRYDVAIIDSTHPKAVDSWILYTAQFYQLLRDRLADGGIAVQWVPLHGLSEREFKIIVRTFSSAFPQMTLWASAGFETYGQVAYAKLVGVKGGPLLIDYDRLRLRLEEPKVKRDLAPFGMASPEELLDLFLAGPDAVRTWTADLPVQTDDHPIVPYTTSFSSGRRMKPAMLLAVRSPVTPLLRGMGAKAAEVRKALQEAYEAQGLVLAGLLERAAETRPQGKKIRLFVEQSRTTVGYYSALAKLYPNDPDKLFEIGTQLGELGFLKQARPLYQQALALRPGDFRIRLNRALLLLDLGEPRRAIELLARLRDERPGSAIVLYNLGATVLAAGDPSVAAAHLEQALAWDEGSLGARLALGQAYLDLQQFDRAEAELRQLLVYNPWFAEAHDLLGLAAARRGEYGLAIQHHTQALGLQPYRSAFRYNLGVALQGKNALRRAEQAYLAALAIDPNYPAALNNLGLVYAKQGHFEQAADLYLQALDADPGHAAAAHNLGLALRGQGRKADAVQAFCLALRLSPDLEAARVQLAGLDAEQEECGR